MSKLSIVVSFVLISAVQSANECCRSDCPGASGEMVCTDCQVGVGSGSCICPSAPEICSGQNGCCTMCDIISTGGLVREDLDDLPALFSVEFPEDIFMFCPSVTDCPSDKRSVNCPRAVPFLAPIRCCRIDCRFGVKCHERELPTLSFREKIQLTECRPTQLCCREDCTGQNVCNVILEDRICDPPPIRCGRSRSQRCCRNDCEVIETPVCENRPLTEDNCENVVQDITCPPTKTCCREECVGESVCKRILDLDTCDPSSLDCATAPPETDAPMTPPPTASRLTISPATPLPSEIATDPPTGTPTTTPPSGRDSQTGGAPDSPTTPPETSSAVETVTSRVIAWLLCSFFN